MPLSLVPGVEIRMPTDVTTFDLEWNLKVMQACATLREHFGELRNTPNCLVRELRTKNAHARLATIVGRALSAAEVKMWSTLLPDCLPMDRASFVTNRAQLTVAPTGEYVERALRTDVFDQVCIWRTRDGRNEMAVGIISGPSRLQDAMLRPEQWATQWYCLARAGDHVPELKQTYLQQLDEEVSGQLFANRFFASTPVVAAVITVGTMGLLHLTDTLRLDTVWGGILTIASTVAVGGLYWICRSLRQFSQTQTLQPLEKLRKDIANLPDQESYALVPSTS